MNIRLSAVAGLLLHCTLHVFGQSPARFDIIIDELLPDPTPAIALPNAEFIELKNNSAVPWDLNGWKISNHSSTSIIKRSVILQPDSFLIVCSTSAVDLYLPFGAVLGISSFPSLGNEGDTISIQSPEGVIVHAIAYKKSFYQNDVKSNGGWSLEMIDTKNPCAFDNWKASENMKGGTPGTINSVDGNHPDEYAPALLRTYTIDSVTVVAIFNEPLDSNSASTIQNYQIDQGVGSPISANSKPPIFTEVELKLPVAMHPNLVYQLTTTNISDCAGNTEGNGQIKIGLPTAADTTDIVINEILFNPKTNGYDYVELYNRSNKIVDLKELFFANKSSSGSFDKIASLSNRPVLFFPGNYFVMTENSESIIQNYLVKHPENIVELTSMPSLPDDHGNIYLLSNSGNTIDALEYDHTWHFGLVNNEEGVALERINYNEATQIKNNWTSASSTSGYGTPTYANSQFAINESSGIDFSVTPKTFSPNNDGYNDYCYINYNLSEPGYSANITIFDAAGMEVRYLARNAILGTNGNFRWDGLNDAQQKLPMGIYVVLAEIFNLNGHVKIVKKAIVLGK